MPREIITIQIGQCGNQSKSFLIKLALSFGNSSANNMASVQMASYRNIPPIIMESKIGKMSSFIKLMTIIIFRALSWSIFSLEYFIFKKGHQYHTN